MTRVEQVAAEEGLEYHLADGVSGNTLLAHELLHLAAEHGRARRAQGAAAARLLRGGPLGLRRRLARRRSPSRSGWTRPRCARRSPTAATWPRSAEDAATAQALGATGVPFFVVDRKYGAAGAQPAELLLQILERAWAESAPAGHRAGRRRLRRRQLRRLTAEQPSSFAAAAAPSRRRRRARGRRRWPSARWSPARPIHPA